MYNIVIRKLYYTVCGNNNVMSNLYRESFSMKIITNCKIHILYLWTKLHPVFLQCLHIILLHMHALLYTVHKYM